MPGVFNRDPASELAAIRRRIELLERRQDPPRRDAVRTVQGAGVPVAQRSILNFATATVTDDPINARTNIDLIDPCIDMFYPFDGDLTAHTTVTSFPPSTINGTFDDALVRFALTAGTSTRATGVTGAGRGYVTSNTASVSFVPREDGGYTAKQAQGIRLTEWTTNAQVSARVTFGSGPDSSLEEWQVTIATGVPGSTASEVLWIVRDEFGVPTSDSILPLGAVDDLNDYWIVTAWYDIVAGDVVLRAEGFGATPWVWQEPFIAVNTTPSGPTGNTVGLLCAAGSHGSTTNEFDDLTVFGCPPE